MKITLILLCLTFAICNCLAQATTYYVSNAGSDDNSGTSIDNAWKTIDKVNAEQSEFKPNDKILFRCGDIFRGKMLITSN